MCKLFFYGLTIRVPIQAENIYVLQNILICLLNASFKLKKLYYTHCFCILISFRENIRQKLLRTVMEFLDPSGSIMLKDKQFLAICTRL
jgi:hypothetical protein